VTDPAPTATPDEHDDTRNTKNSQVFFTVFIVPSWAIVIAVSAFGRSGRASDTVAERKRAAFPPIVRLGDPPAPVAKIAMGG
jgi:hypothetical protein